MHIEEVIKQRTKFGKSDRIIVYTVDGRTGELISEYRMKSEYYDDKRADVLKRLYERVYQEVDAFMHQVAKPKTETNHENYN